MGGLIAGVVEARAFGIPVTTHPMGGLIGTALAAVLFLFQ